MERGNPDQLFPTDEPIKSREMIGRADDINEIVVQLQVGANVIIAAPRRTGKTSLCEAVIERLRKDGCYVVAVDLYLISDIDQLAESIVEQAFSNRPVLKKALHTAKVKGQAIYDAISLSATLKSPHDLEGIDINLLPMIQKDPVAYLDYALKLPEKLAAADGKRLIFFIDEFQDVERIGDNFKRGWSRELKRKMRASFQKSPNVSFLFAGSLEHMMRVIFGHSDEPFYNFGSFQDIALISAEEWQEGLAKKFKRDHTTIDDDALEAIIERGQSHPRSTMLLAQRSHIASVLAQTQHITLPMADAAYVEALRVERPKHESWVERIQRIGKPAINRVALRVITAVAKKEPPYSDARYPNEVARALDALRDAGFIESPAKRQWHVVDPLFEAYLSGLEVPEP
jgi:hypothetical protein